MTDTAVTTFEQARQEAHRRDSGSVRTTLQRAGTAEPDSSTKARDELRRELAWRLEKTRVQPR